MSILLSACEDEVRPQNAYTAREATDYTLFPSYYDADKCYVYHNLDGEIILNDNYHKAGLFYNGYATVSHKPFGELFHINTQGEKIGNKTYDEAQAFYNEYAVVKKASADGYSYINKHGERAFSGEFAYAYLFSDKLAPVKDKTYTVLHSNNNGVEEYTYDYFYYIDTDGEVAINNNDYVLAYPFYKGYAVAAIRHGEGYLYERKYGLINTKGDTKVNFEYDDAQIFCTEGRLAVKKNKQWGFVNTQGEEVIPFDYEMAYPFLEGFAAVCIEKNTWLFIDKNGTESTFPYTFQAVNNGFSEGLAAVQYNDLWGYINTSGEFIIEAQFSHQPSMFINGYALGDKGVIDKKGRLVFSYASPIYEKSARLNTVTEETLEMVLFKQP